MDYLAKGRALAKDGKHEEALDALYLALENDKENPDTHFFIGLCFSALEEFEYAKYHYQLARVINPNHEKTNLMWDGLAHIEAKKPPEKRIVKKAEAQERREQASAKPKDEPDPAPTQIDQTVYGASHETKNVAEEKWEEAFPTDHLKAETKIPAGQKVLIFAVLIIILGAIGYFIFQTFLAVS